MLGISATIAIGALALLLASHYRRRNRDLPINRDPERSRVPGAEPNVRSH